MRCYNSVGFGPGPHGYNFVRHLYLILYTDLYTYLLVPIFCSFRHIVPVQHPTWNPAMIQGLIKKNNNAINLAVISIWVCIHTEGFSISSVKIMYNLLQIRHNHLVWTPLDDNVRGLAHHQTLISYILLKKNCGPYDGLSHRWFERFIL